MPAPDEKTDASVKGSSSAVARRARPIYRVFVSSTWIYLQPERRALMDALNRMEEMRFVGMEFFGNRPDDTHDASIHAAQLALMQKVGFGYRFIHKLLLDHLAERPAAGDRRV